MNAYMRLLHHDANWQKKAKKKRKKYPSVHGQYEMKHNHNEQRQSNNGMCTASESTESTNPFANNKFILRRK